MTCQGEPWLLGSLVRERVRCGKRCRCAWDREARHVRYRVYWQEVDPATGEPQVRRKYIRKADVARVRRRMAAAKRRRRGECSQEQYLRQWWRRQLRRHVPWLSLGR